MKTKNKAQRHKDKKPNNLKKLCAFVPLFKSTKLTIFLLIIFAIFILIGLFIPQKSQTNYNQWFYTFKYANFFEKLQLTRIFTSYCFIFTSTLLFFNNLVCTYNRVRFNLKKKSILPV